MPATLMTRRIESGSVLVHTSPQLHSLPGPEKWGPPSEEEREVGRKIAATSLARSRQRIAEWLSVPCEKHGAKPGQKCSEFVGGICGARIEASRA